MNLITPNKSKLKIVVGINSLVSTTQPAYSNHIQFFFRLGRNHPDIDFILVNPSRMGIDRMRNLCAQTALNYEADYILFLDDDVLVPFDSLHYLLECNADIVAGDVLIRGYPFNHMCFRRRLITDTLDPEGLNLLPIEEWKEEEKGKVVDVDAVGFSLCLIKMDCIKRTPAPWFLTGPRNTEDVFFCIRAKQASPETTIKLDTRVVCAHILWSEFISIENRAEYKKYMEAQYGEGPERKIKENEDSTPVREIKVKQATEVPISGCEKSYDEVMLREMGSVKFAETT